MLDLVGFPNPIYLFKFGVVLLLVSSGFLDLDLEDCPSLGLEGSPYLIYFTCSEIPICLGDGDRTDDLED